MYSLSSSQSQLSSEPDKSLLNWVTNLTAGGRGTGAICLVVSDRYLIPTTEDAPRGTAANGEGDIVRMVATWW